MAKLKKPVKSNNDTQVASVVLGLFVVGIILFFIFSKAKESHKENVIHKESVIHREVEVQRENIPAPSEEADSYIPNENVKPVEASPAPQEIPSESFKKIPGSGGKIAIIIDDWGQTTANCRYLKDIPEPLAVSILPGLRHTKDVASCAGRYHKLAMLHLPLEALYNNDFYPPNYIIKTSMSPELVSKIVDQDLDQLPTIEGVNNHMGSKATADRALMSVIFKRIKRKNLFFVDSMTSRYSVSAALAGEMGLAYARRDVFLDNVNTREAIIKQFVALAQKARHRGYAVAIGHDRHLTMQVIKDEIPWLEKQGFQIVSIKTLLKNK